jgi:hypothetical protein
VAASAASNMMRGSSDVIIGTAARLGVAVGAVAVRGVRLNHRFMLSSPVAFAVQ